MSLPSSMADFVPCDRLLQKAYCFETAYVTGQNDRQTQILSGQIVILAGHCPVTGRYFEHWSIDTHGILAIYQTRERVFHRVIQTRRRELKYDAQRRISDEIRGV